MATSDGVEQMVVMGRGAIRVSARELLIEMDQVRSQGRQGAVNAARSKNSVMDRLPDDVRRRLDEMMRSGKTNENRRK